MMYGPWIGLAVSAGPLLVWLLLLSLAVNVMLAGLLLLDRPRHLKEPKP